MKQQRLLFLLPLFLMVALFCFFQKGLKQDPRLLPSTLISHPAPKFSLSSLEEPHQKYSEKFFLKHFTLLNVWASWCETCQEEQSFLLALHKKYPSLQIVGLNYKDNTHHARAWLKQYGNPYTLILEDRDGKTAINYGVYGTPETFLIDPHGVIVAKQVGVLNEENFNAHFLPRIVDTR